MRLNAVAVYLNVGNSTSSPLESRAKRSRSIISSKLIALEVVIVVEEVEEEVEEEDMEGGEGAIVDGTVVFVVSLKLLTRRDSSTSSRSRFCFGFK